MNMSFVVVTTIDNVRNSVSVSRHPNMFLLSLVLRLKRTNCIYDAIGIVIDYFP